MSTQLSPHWTLEEMIESEKAVELGIDNTPPPDIVDNLRVLCNNTLEPVRAFLGVPMLTSSGFRCLALNSALPGSSPTSDHMKGWCLDFEAPAYGTPLVIVKAIAASNLKWDQLIQEGTWVHISGAPAMRREVLTKTIVNGQLKYTEGV